MKRLIFLTIISLYALFAVSSAWAQKTVRLSMATGDREGIYDLLGRGMAGVISQYLSYAEVSPVIPKTSMDKCLWVGQGQGDLAFISADRGWEAYHGKGSFKNKIPVRVLAVLYPSCMHLVVEEGKGIERVLDLRGKRVSIGAPESKTEKMVLRILEAYGLNPDKDIRIKRFTLTESTRALSDKKIDAFFWLGGLPTSALIEMGTPPGIRMKLIDVTAILPKLQKRYGPIYVKGIIPSRTYPGQETEVPIAMMWNLLICHEEMTEGLAYDLVKTVFEHQQELGQVHPVTQSITLASQKAENSPIPFHPGAMRYFTEKRALKTD